MNQIIKEKCTSWPADGDCPVLHSRVHRVCVCVKQSCCTDTEVTNYQPVAPLLYNIILSWANPTSLWRRNVEYYYLLHYTTGHAAPFGHNQQNTKSKLPCPMKKCVYYIYRIRNTYIVMDVRYYRTVFDAILLHGFGRFGRAQKRARSHFIIELTVVSSANASRYWLADNIKKLMTIRTFIYS